MDADSNTKQPVGTPTDAEAATVDFAIREDQIQNAVAFLSHPKVRGSPVSAKRSFLEKKGLTADEIDEALKRVPEAPAAAAAATVPAGGTPTVGANNLVTYTQQPSHGSVAGQVHQAPSPAGALIPVQQHQQQQLMPPPQPEPLRWTQVVLGLGVAAVSLYGLHQLLAPRVMHWANQFTAARKAAQEAEAARTAALTAALESLADGQRKLLESIEGLTTAVHQQQQQQQQRPGSSQKARQVGMYGASVTEEASSISFQRGAHDEYLRCQSPGLPVVPGRQQQQYSSTTQYSHAQQYSSASGPNSADSTTQAAALRSAGVRGWDPYADPSRGAVIRSGGYAGSSSGISSNMPPRDVAGGSMPGGASGPADGFEVVPCSMQAASSSTTNANSSNAAPAGGGVRQHDGSGRPDEAPHSAAFHEVMEMVRAGITPPNVRSDINDSPPDPSRPISAPQLAPRGKPWEHSSASSGWSGMGSSGRAASAGDGVVMQHSQQPQYGASGAANGYGAAAADTQALAACSEALMANMEASAAGVRQKSMEQAGSGYSLSHLLGPSPGSGTKPWQPPPPPEPTLLARPSSSGSSSSRTGNAAAMEAATGVATVASVSMPAAPTAEEVVASVAASAVRNAVAAAAAETAAA